MHRGYPDLLPHGDGSDRDPGPVVWRFEQPAFFPRQLDIGPLAETKAADVAKEPILSQTEPQLDGAHVTRLGHHVGDSQRTEGFVVVDSMPRKHDLTHLTVDHLVGLGQVFLQRCAHRHQLERRAWLVDPAHRPVHPGCLPAFRVIVGVQSRRAGHSKDIACAGVLDDDRSARRMPLFDGLGQRFLRNVLDIFIQG